MQLRHDRGESSRWERNRLRLNPILYKKNDLIGMAGSSPHYAVVGGLIKDTLCPSDTSGTFLKSNNVWIGLEEQGSCCIRGHLLVPVPRSRLGRLATGKLGAAILAALSTMGHSRTRQQHKDGNNAKNDNRSELPNHVSFDRIVLIIGLGVGHWVFLKDQTRSVASSSNVKYSFCRYHTSNK
eukprot:scaffold22681_cov146-Cylindrotheca_fusiformis.AAC.12